jgi:hypothetical protein
MNGLDKRRIQRIDLDQPVDANFLNTSVTLLDLSTAGARIEHTAPMKAGRQSRLEFEFGAARIAVLCEVVRSRLQRSSVKGGAIVYQTGLRFVDPAEPARATVRQIVAAIVTSRLHSGNGQPEAAM